MAVQTPVNDRRLSAALDVIEDFNPKIAQECLENLEEAESDEEYEEIAVEVLDIADRIKRDARDKQRQNNPRQSNSQRQSSRSGRVDRFGTPLSRGIIDTARTPLRILFGLGFVAYSSIATVRLMAMDISPALGATMWGPLQAVYVISAVFAAIIFFWELITSEAGWLWYIIPFIPDLIYTHRQTMPWVSKIVAANVTDPTVSFAVAFFISIVSSAAVSYYGERLLFGKRR